MQIAVGRIEIAHGHIGDRIEIGRRFQRNPPVGIVVEQLDHHLPVDGDRAPGQGKIEETEAERLAAEVCRDVGDQGQCAAGNQERYRRAVVVYPDGEIRCQRGINQNTGIDVDTHVVGEFSQVKVDLVIHDRSIQVKVEEQLERLRARARQPVSGINNQREGSERFGQRGGEIEPVEFGYDFGDRVVRGIANERVLCLGDDALDGLGKTYHIRQPAVYRLVQQRQLIGKSAKVVAGRLQIVDERQQTVQRGLDVGHIYGAWKTIVEQCCVKHRIVTGPAVDAHRVQGADGQIRRRDIGNREGFIADRD